jgi:hypothetical protein
MRTPDLDLMILATQRNQSSPRKEGRQQYDALGADFAAATAAERALAVLIVDCGRVGHCDRAPLHNCRYDEAYD